MAGECTYDMHYANDDTFGETKHTTDRQQELNMGCLNGVSITTTSSPFFEIKGGALYRKKLERGIVHYREVLVEDRRHQAIASLHVRRPGKLHHTLEDTYRLVAEQYWWEGMYFQVRDFVQECEECKQRWKERQEFSDKRCVSRTVMSHGQEMLNKLNVQRAAGLYCDIILMTGDGLSFPAHKAVLAAVSEYFQEVFTEMDSASDPQTRIDLTGFNEEILLPLLEFSYTSTLTLNLDKLTEVTATARHLRMWLALDVCSAIQKEQETGQICPKTQHPFGTFNSCGSPSLNTAMDGRIDGCKRKREPSHGGMEERGEGSRSYWNTPSLGREHFLNESFKLIQGLSDESDGEASNYLSRPLSENHGFLAQPQTEENGFPCSPTRRMKLMDFKSPSSKRQKHSPRSSSSIVSLSPSTSTRSSSPSRRLLRSTPGAALALRRLLPKIDLSKSKRKSSSLRTYRMKPDIPVARSRLQSTPGTSCCPAAPAKVKEEAVEEEVTGSAPQEEVQSPRAQEKYRLLSFLGLQRKSLVPGPEELSGWGQKKRLRKLKVSSYSLTVRRKPRSQGLTAGYEAGLGALAGANPSLSLCDMTKMDLLKRVMIVEPQQPIGRVKRQRHALAAESSVRNTRSRTASRPQPLRQPETRARNKLQPGDRAPSQRTSKSRATNRGTQASKSAVLKIKQEPDDFSVTPPVRNTPPCGQALPLRSPTANRSASRGHAPADRAVKMASTESKRTVRYNSGRTAAKTKHNCGARAKRQGRGKGGVEGKNKQENKVNASANRGRERAEAHQRSDALQDFSSTNHQHLHSHPLYRAIKEEPMDPLPLSEPFPAHEASDLGKRQSKPPVKMLDPGFLFGLCRTASGIKREEESVDICLTRSVSHGNASHEDTATGTTRRDRMRARIMPDRTGLNGPHWAVLGPRHSSHSMGRPVRVKVEREETSLRPVRVKREREEISVSQRAKVNRVHKHSNKANPPKRKDMYKLHPLQSRRSVLLKSIRLARVKQLRAPGSQGAAHSCLQCRTSYRDCDALVMHRMKHIEGKHWPCPLCSKTFFRQKNVRNHIRTHDPKLYKCRQCMASSMR